MCRIATSTAELLITLIASYTCRGASPAESREPSEHCSLRQARDGWEVWGTVCGRGRKTHKSVALCANSGMFSLLLLKLQCCGWPCPLPREALVKVLYPFSTRSHVLYVPQHLTPCNTCRPVSGCALYLCYPSPVKDKLYFGSRSPFDRAKEAATKRHPGHSQNDAQEQQTKENSLQKLATTLHLPTQYIYSIFVRTRNNVYCWESFYCTIGLFICLQRASLV